MNNSLVLKGMILLCSISIFISCKKEPITATESPNLEIKEVGTANSRIVYAGQDLHLDAEIKAPQKIASVKVQITLKATNYGWSFIKTYTDGYQGSKNVRFHEHIDVPENALAGIYDLLMIATDENGNKTQSITNFEIKRDASLPSATGTLLKLSGNTLTVSTNVSAPNKLAKIAVQLQSPSWTRQFEYIDSDLVGSTNYAFNKVIDLSEAPNGHYHVNIRILDQTGKFITYSPHFDK
ncbi:MAG: DUF4625 domain-containing protein [Pedobacter sp.]|nr:MAG: DUF4625 domain-containing protein [Pedobacter sp.]